MKQFIRQYYPDAKEGLALTGSCMAILTGRFGFDPEKTLLATSACSDEIIRSATNFRNHLGIESPFQLGGLAGYPFTGLTGVRAFASHIPDDGSAIILYGPHIGVSASGEVGTMQRLGQKHESSCCGALQASFTCMSRQEDPDADPDLDHQLWKIESELMPGREQFLTHSQPLVAVTDKMYEVINRQLELLIETAGTVFRGKQLALIGGVIINTDYDLPDWFDIRHFDVIGSEGEKETVSIDEL